MSGKEKITEQEVPMRLFALSKSAGKPSVDMNQVVGKCDILMICLDTLRYDVAHQEESAGNTPVLNRYGKNARHRAISPILPIMPCFQGFSLANTMPGI